MRPESVAQDRSSAPPRPLKLTRLASTKGFHARKSVRASLAVDPSLDLGNLAERLSAIIASHCSPSAENGTPKPPELQAGPDIQAERANPISVLATALMRSAAALLDAAGIPVIGGARIFRRKHAEDADSAAPIRFQLAIPAVSPEATADALAWVIDLANALSGERPVGADLSIERRGALDRLMEKLRSVAPADNNRRHMIRAAYDLEIPYISLPMDLIQLGWGKSARLFRSSDTEATPVIGAVLAKNKLAAGALLRAAEIPVPEHALAVTADAASEAAWSIGFPVVVKPVDLDRGFGAKAGLATEEKVRQAYESARALSVNVMVEKHVDGQEYRLLVVNGRLFWAYERVPATIIGDGISTVRQLIDIRNRARRAGPSTGLSLVAIGLDDPVREMLKHQDMMVDSIPPAGRVVQLQRIPSIAGGGEVRAVFDSIHPDNARAAERAARLLRLDIAGIDFLTPDITRSWREVGGRITEVNSQPQISPLSRPDMYRALLKELVPNGGRVPVVLAFGADMTAMRTETQHLLAKADIRAGIASNRSIFVGEDEIAQGAFDAFHGVHALILDPTVEAIIVLVDGMDVLKNGLPFDRIDLVVVAGGMSDMPDFRRMLSIAKAHLHGNVLAAREDPAISDITEVIGTETLRLAKSPSTIAGALARFLAAQVNGIARIEA